jgi:hypothetical protein
MIEPSRPADDGGSFIRVDLASAGLSPRVPSRAKSLDCAMCFNSSDSSAVSVPADANSAIPVTYLQVRCD